MISYRKFNDTMNCNEYKNISFSDIKKIYSNFNERDIRIIKLDFEGDIAQIVIKPNGFLIKLYPIACLYISDDSPLLVVLNVENSEVKDYCNYLTNGKMKIEKLNPISFIENLLCYHSENLDRKISELSNNIKNYTFDKIQSKDLYKIAKIFHDLLLLKTQYQEIEQTISQVNEYPNEKLKIIGDVNKIEEFTRTINIYQNEFEEDIKNLNRMVKEIEILIQMTDIKFSERRNNIAILSLNLDLIILSVSIISMFGSLFGMNLNSSFEDVKYGLYFITIIIVSVSSFIYIIVKKFIINELFK